MIISQGTKVMIVSDDPMGGHRAAAKAVNEALRSMDDVQSDVFEFHDSCDKTRRFIREEQISFRLATPKLTRHVFKRAMNPSGMLKWFWKAMSWVNHMTMREAQAAVKRENPDVLLSVHMGTNAMSRIWEKNGALDAPAHCVVTDFIAHGVWPSDNIKRYYVASEAVKKDLVGYGVDAAKVKVTGIPISPRISAPDTRSQADVKAALGLDPSRPVIMIMGGSRGDQKFIPILDALDKQKTNAQVVCICGRNAGVKQMVEEFAKVLKIDVHATPFVDMRDYYHAADVVVTKPGGLTTSEALVKGKAIVLVSPYPGMEEAQVGRLTDEGVAVFGSTPTKAAEMAIGILGDDAQKTALETAAKAFGRPDAAMDIARDLVASRRP